MGFAEAVLSVLIATVVPSLYEEFGRVKVAKSMVLVGVTMMLLGILHPVFRDPHSFVIVFIVSVMLAVGGIYVSNVFGDLFSGLLLDAYLCLYTGEDCEVVIEEKENLIESLINRVSDLLIGRWTPLREWFEEIAENPKKAAKISAYSLLYQASSLSLALFIVLTL